MIDGTEFRVARRATTWLVSASLVAAVVTAIVLGATPSRAEAAPVAPVPPLPACVYDDEGVAQVGCAPDGGDFGAKVEGQFGVGDTFTVITTPGDRIWCHHFRDTGCLYGISTPTVVKCVYLFDDDPTDVRTCGTDLSTIGPVGAFSAERQGSCTGELGGTYAHGGPTPDPSRYWDARAPQIARCDFDVASPYPIDNLKGPTFFLMSTRVIECVEEFGFGCDEDDTIYDYHFRYVWVPVRGTLAPRASFNWSETIPEGTIEFENTSVPFNGVVTWDWDFDDADSYSTDFEPTHTYEESGVYRVELTMTGPEEGQMLTTSRNVIVNLEGVDMMVKVYDPGIEILPDDNPDGPPGPAGYELGDLFVARIEVFNIGDGDLFNVRPIAQLLQQDAMSFDVATLDRQPCAIPVGHINVLVIS